MSRKRSKIVVRLEKPTSSEDNTTVVKTTYSSGKLNHEDLSNKLNQVMLNRPSKNPNALDQSGDDTKKTDEAEDGEKPQEIIEETTQPSSTEKKNKPKDAKRMNLFAELKQV